MHSLVIAGAATFDLSTVLQAGVETVSASIDNALIIVVPAIIAITGTIVAVKFGIRWLKKLGKG